MLRFNNHANRDDRPRPPANYLGRRQQLRLLVLVGGLAAVLATMHRLRQPETIAQIDAVLSGPSPNAATPIEAPTPDSTQTAAYKPTPLELLDTIRDNTFFRNAESAAWFAMLASVRDTAPASLAAAAEGPLSYAQLARQPRVYRGRPVTVSGDVRRVEQVTPADNEQEIDKLYRLILEPRGGEVWPITLYSLEPPPGTPLGEIVRLPAEATGLFFKNQSYRWRDGLGVTPVVITNRINVLKPPLPRESKAESSYSASEIVGAAALVSAGLLLVVWLRTRPTPRHRRHRTEAPTG